MMNKKNTNISYYVNTQNPLDAKLWVRDVNELIDLGPDNEKAYKYYKGMFAYVMSNDNVYRWTEWDPQGSIEGLIPNGFTYPECYTNEMYDYAEKTFNFVLVNIGFEDEDLFDESIWARIGSTENFSNVTEAIHQGFNHFYFKEDYNITELDDTFDYYVINSNPNIIVTINNPLQKDLKIIDTNIRLEGNVGLIIANNCNITFYNNAIANLKVTDSDINFADNNIITGFIIRCHIQNGNNLNSSCKYFQCTGDLEITSGFGNNIISNHFTNLIITLNNNYISNNHLSLLNVSGDNNTIIDNKINTLNINGGNNITLENNYIENVNIDSSVSLKYWNRTVNNLQVVEHDETKGNVEVIDRRRINLESPASDHLSYPTTKAVTDWAEKRSNKTADIEADNDNVHYPTTNAVVTYINNLGLSTYTPNVGVSSNLTLDNVYSCYYKDFGDFREYFDKIDITISGTATDSENISFQNPGVSVLSINNFIKSNTSINNNIFYDISINSTEINFYLDCTELQGETVTIYFNYTIKRQ